MPAHETVAEARKPPAGTSRANGRLPMNTLLCRAVHALAALVALLLVPTATAGRDDRPLYEAPARHWALQALVQPARHNAAHRLTVFESKGSTIPRRFLEHARPVASVSYQVLTMDGAQVSAGRTIPLTDQGLQMGAVPRGVFLLQAMSHGADGEVVDSFEYVLNMIEGAPSSGKLPPPCLSHYRAGDTPALRVAPSSGNACGALRAPLDVVVRHGDGEAAQFRCATLPCDADVVPPLQPGTRTSLLVELFDANHRRQFASTMTIGWPGDFPARVSAPSAVAPVEWPRAAWSETISAALPFAQQQAGLAAQLDGSRARGVRLIHLDVDWASVEPLLGVRDWSNLDRYVALLTERRLPFSLQGLTSLQYGNGPRQLWGDWMLDEHGDFRLWRNLPTMSPASEAYRAAALGFVRAAVERYRSNPFLVGYSFVNAGRDSGLYLDHTRRSTDYSHAQRARCGITRPPRPDWLVAIDTSDEWRRWSECKLATYTSFYAAINGLVRTLDPQRTVLHYAAYTGPFEHLYLSDTRWVNADGGGGDPQMSTITALSAAWNADRQTELHAVPPADLAEWRRLQHNLALGGAVQHGKFVFNTDANLFTETYPAERALRESLAWAQDHVRLDERTATFAAGALQTGFFLSWADLFHRTRVWRWYGLPVSSARRWMQAVPHPPVRWVSELSPEGSWQALQTLVVTADAQVWSGRTLERLREFLLRGGHLLIEEGAGVHAVEQATAAPVASLLLGVPAVDDARATPVGSITLVPASCMATPDCLATMTDLLKHAQSCQAGSDCRDAAAR